jgi:hypothetical protein
MTSGVADPSSPLPHSTFNGRTWRGRARSAPSGSSTPGIGEDLPDMVRQRVAAGERRGCAGHLACAIGAQTDRESSAAGR